MTRRTRTPAHTGPDLLDVLEEASDNPPLCSPSHSTGVKGGGWSLEVSRDSRYYGMWVHANVNCRRPRHLSKQKGF